MMSHYSRPSVFILDYLVARYGNSLQQAGKSAEEVEAELQALRGFQAFCAAELDQNRPSQVSYETRNFGILLSNGDHVLVAPDSGEAEHGDLDKTTYVPANGPLCGRQINT